VYGSKRWCRGPDQRDLTQHIDADSGIAVILTMLEAGHYGVFPTSRSSEIRIHEGWRKIYGPVFYMLTQGGSAQEMYEQAAARGIVDRDQWPPPWLAEAVGPLTTVTGQIAPNSIDEPVRVVLNNDRYVFWATCQPGEAFQIPDVSPDTYRLTARQGPHAIAQLSDVQIGQDAFDAGEIQLTPAIPPGKILWEIGTLDDSCEEFSGGHHCWEFHGYEAYASEAQDPCVYTIGQSRPERDWYWIHPGPIDGWAGGKIHPRTIQFELETIPENPLLLHIALADTMSAAHIPPPIYHVQLNDQELAVIELSDGGQAGSYCVASVGVPQNYRVSISPESLVVGVNRLVIYPKEQSYVMYDYLALQEPDVLPH